MATAPVNAPLSSVNTSSAPTETFEPLQISATEARKGYGQHTTMSMSRDTLFAEATTCTRRNSRFNPLNKHNLGYKQTLSQRSAAPEKSVLARHDPCTAAGRQGAEEVQKHTDATRTRPSRAAHHARMRDARGLGSAGGQLATWRSHGVLGPSTSLASFLASSRVAGFIFQLPAMQYLRSPPRSRIGIPDRHTGPACIGTQTLRQIDAWGTRAQRHWRGTCREEGRRVDRQSQVVRRRRHTPRRQRSSLSYAQTWPWRVDVAGRMQRGSECDCDDNQSYHINCFSKTCLVKSLRRHAAVHTRGCSGGSDKVRRLAPRAGVRGVY